MLAVGQWVTISAAARKAGGLKKMRGCIDELKRSSAWVRFAVEGWPFPKLVEVPLAWLEPAPTPRSPKPSGKIE